MASRVDFFALEAVAWARGSAIDARIIRVCPPQEFLLSTSVSREVPLLFFRSSLDESYELQTRSRKTEHRDGRGKTSNHRTSHICAYSQLTSVFLDHNRAGRVFILDSLKREGID